MFKTDSPGKNADSTLQQTTFTTSWNLSKAKRKPTLPLLFSRRWCSCSFFVRGHTCRHYMAKDLESIRAIAPNQIYHNPGRAVNDKLSPAS